MSAAHPRVLAVGNLYPPHDLGGGYELVWQRAMEHLTTNGMEVKVLASDHREETDALETEDVERTLRWYWRNHAFPPMRRRDVVRLELHNAAVLRRTLRSFRPDVVTWWSMGGMSLSLLEHVRRARIPAVAFVHDDWLIYGREVDRWHAAARAHPWLARLVPMPARVDFAGAARYVFVSRTTRERARRSGVALFDTGIAHSGIDASYLDPRPPQPWRWRLLYVGRVDLRKGIETAVEALAHLPAQATLEIIGGGGDQRDVDALTRRARDLGVLDRVRFAGRRTRAELPGAYAACDAVVFPVVWEEPWGLVPLEAMALGRPVVATGRGGSGEYLRDGENCLLFEAGDATALAAAVRRLASDEALRAGLADDGLQTARRHTDVQFNAAVLDEVRAAAVRGRRP